MHTNRDWVACLPTDLDLQQQALEGLLKHVESMPTIASFSVGCSLGRGAADALSDVDAAIGVRAPRGPAGAALVRDVEKATVDLLPELGALVDVLRQETEHGGLFLRRVFAQYGDRLELDLAVIADSDVRRGDAAPDFIELYRSGSVHEPTDHPSALQATSAQLHEWVFRAWRGLLDADKYLRRGSLWEAHQRLHETRDHVWKLWAAAQGAIYPGHGLSQVLDHDPDVLPDHIEDTVSGIDHDALQRAVLAAADVLDQAIGEAERSSGIPLSLPIGGYARRTIATSPATGNRS